mmetsp:Transcript_41197/g.46533  ORF Transcript_41197/g.46533 Transcript_41197/m.46533 type:complete len:478 (-) Transcript_41197:114-1547(-)
MTNRDPTIFALPHNSVTDDREPLFTFYVPNTFTVDGTTTSVNEYGFLGISIIFWIELLGMFLITIVVAAIIGLLLYWIIMQPKQTETTKAYLIGWGLIIPFWIAYPFIFCHYLGITNNIFKFLVGGVAPVAYFFRTTECIYGFAPLYTTRSAQEFVFYYASFPIVARVKRNRKQQEEDENQNQNQNQNKNKNDTNNKEAINGVKKIIGDPIKCTFSKTMSHLCRFIGWLFLLGALQSILNPHRYFGFFGHMPQHGDKESWYALERFLTWQLYANSAAQALFFQLYITTYCEALIFAFTVLTGFEAEPAMDNPMLRSESPSDFWGRRWNLIVHTVLKNGVYKPTRKYFSRTTAVLTTFLTSGIFHEWILMFVFGSDFSTIIMGQQQQQPQPLYKPVYGSAIVFFLWQALLIGLEFTLGGSTVVRNVSKIMPRPVKTAFIVGMGVPLAHFFLEPYIRSESFFVHGAAGLPMIVPIIRKR